MGEAVANLNTIVVGLDAVEKGHPKPDSLNISWNPKDRIAAARKARRFALGSALVTVAEALDEFISAISELEHFDETRATWDKNTKRAQKLESIAKKALSRNVADHERYECYLIVGSALLIHWRNRFVHFTSNADITPTQRKVFLKNADYINENYAGFLVDKLFLDFEQGTPTLKDITTLISMTIKLCRKIDAELTILSETDFLVLMNHYGLQSKITEIERNTTPAKRRASILRMLQSTAPGLADHYERLEAILPTAE